MKYINYGKQWINFYDIWSVCKNVRSDFLTQGPYVKKFEHQIAEKLGVRYCVVVSNGTAALHLSVASLSIKNGSEGITTPISFVATSNSMIYNNIKPVFCDIDPKTYCIDPGKIFELINPKTKLILPVHFAGHPANMSKIHKLAKSKKIFVIEDAAHALGSKYSDGSFVGNCKYSDLTIFSFHPVKTITTGEGGAITTNSKQLYEKLLLLRSHGIAKDENSFQNKISDNQDHIKNKYGPWYYEMQLLGFNYRLTDFQSCLGASQLNRLDKFVKRRREIIEHYNDAFCSIDWIKIPCEEKNVFSAYHLYVLQIDYEKIGKNRKEVMELLKTKGIGTQVHYIPIHTQPFYQKHFGTKWGDFPIAENYYNNALSIPLYPKMSNKDVKYVIKNIKGLYV